MGRSFHETQVGNLAPPDAARSRNSHRPSPARADDAVAGARAGRGRAAAAARRGHLRPPHTLTQALASLSDVKSDFLVLSNVSNMVSDTAHGAATAAFLSPYATLKSTTSVRQPVSADQLMAKQLAQYTRLPSIEIGPIRRYKEGATCGDNYSCTYLYNVSWIAPTVPAARLMTPRAVFDTLFPNFDASLTPEEREKRNADDRSLLDAVLEDTARLKAKLGTADALRLEEYLTSVRELERRTDAFVITEQCNPGDVPSTDPPYDVRLYTDLMTDYIAAAFQCDQTRVATFMVAGGGNSSRQAFPFLGISSNHHTLSHHQNDPAKLSALSKIDAWHVTVLGKLVRKLKALKDPDGMTLLDTSMIYFSSELSNGNGHIPRKLPVLVAGRGRDAIRPGRHIRYGTEQPVANLLLTFLNAMGVAKTSYGDSTRPLTLT
jgi:hypothetical protein